MNASLPFALLAEPAHHGGPDARGPARWDFSTNSNACGPCPYALAAVQQADASRYPDPRYTALRTALAEFHGVSPARIVLAASASEFIGRITMLAARHGAQAVSLPRHSYGDYAQAAQAWGLPLYRRPHAAPADLHWLCEPSSPLGQPEPALAQPATSAGSHRWQVLDCAYRPLQLEGQPSTVPTHVWQLWTPNKALGLTGVRAAYAIAPLHPKAAEDVAELVALAPSWPVGAHGVALLQAWTEARSQTWLAHSLHTLRQWKQAQLALCAQWDWAVQAGSLANYFVVRPRTPNLADLLAQLRQQDIQLRDCHSFGLPGWVRMGVLAPAAQQALQTALQRIAPRSRRRGNCD